MSSSGVPAGYRIGAKGKFVKKRNNMSNKQIKSYVRSHATYGGKPAKKKRFVMSDAAIDAYVRGHSTYGPAAKKRKTPMTEAQINAAASKSYRPKRRVRGTYTKSRNLRANPMKRV